MDWKKQLDALRTQLPEAENTVEENVTEHKKTIKQTLRVELDKRKGKTATLISEFEGTDEELKELSKQLKTKLAAGGSQRDGEILIQGDFRSKISDLLQNMGYKVKKINFK